MKIAAIIAEYNPFHNGHAFQIKSVREKTGADAIVVLMSGNFVQRGTPAIVDKYTRANMALLCGADLILELPCALATSSAEGFAFGAVALLDALNCVDYLCFGAETDQLSVFLQIGKILSTQPPDYCRILKASLKEGLSFPAARSVALGKILSVDPSFFTLPNNILALEYCKALSALHSSITPVLIPRNGAQYHEETLSAIDADATDFIPFSSATAIRKSLWELLTETPDFPVCLEHLSTRQQIIFSQIPVNARQPLADALSTKRFIFPDQLSLPLHLKLLSGDPAQWTKYLDVSESLAQKISNQLPFYCNYTQFCSLLKTKDLTHTRITRSLLHILLEIQEDFFKELTASRSYYVRPLGFARHMSSVLGQIKSNSVLPLLSDFANAFQTISNFSAFDDTQKDLAAQSLSLDIKSTHLYEALLTNTTGQPGIPEYKRKMLILP